MTQSKIYQLYLQLLKKYGAPREFWKEWCKDNKSPLERERITLGAILTQRTNWRNVELAMDNLRKAKSLSIKGIYQVGKKDMAALEQLIRPAGFYTQKAKRIFGFCQFIVEGYGGLARFFQGSAPGCREKLLALPGVGPETADDILLYAGDKLIFVIDEYTRRFAAEHKLASKLSYDHLQQLFQDNLPEDIKVYRDFHAMIVLEGRRTGWDLIFPVRQ